MYEFVQNPNRDDLARLAVYLTDVDAHLRVTPPLGALRARVAARLAETARANTGALSQDEKRRYHALRLFVK